MSRPSSLSIGTGDTSVSAGNWERSTKRSLSSSPTRMATMLRSCPKTSVPVVPAGIVRSSPAMTSTFCDDTTSSVTKGRDCSIVLAIVTPEPTPSGLALRDERNGVDLELLAPQQPGDLDRRARRVVACEACGSHLAQRRVVLGLGEVDPHAHDVGQLAPGAAEVVLELIEDGVRAPLHVREPVEALGNRLAAR